MKLSDLKNNIADACKHIKTKHDSFITEMVFFKCFVLFEVFICDLFSDYAIGIKNERNYIPPTRELQFKDKDTLDKFLTINRTYTEYFKIAEENADLFFKPNPFQVLNDSVYSSFLKEMKLIRNVIAHNSPEAIGRYEKIVLNGGHMEVGAFLSTSIKGSNISHLDNYIKCMIEMAEKALVN